jgi:TolB protein
VDIDGEQQELEITGWTYDLAVSPTSDDFIFSFSRGLGSGSELNFTQNHGRTAKALYEDPLHYIAFARYSPDGEHIAFIKIPDSATPFTVGELWIVDADGSNARKLADVDAGHGYAATWSPDGTQIAFVQRENPQDENANQSTESLISNIYTVDVHSGVASQITHFEDGRAETPRWSPDGNTLSFTVVIDGRMNVFTVDITTGQTRSLITESTCCPAWMRR